MYGAYIVRGVFGAGKSYYTHRSFTGSPLLPFSGKAVNIGNYTSPDFDIEFRSVNDLISILMHIYRYKKDPSTINQKINIIVDEAPLYFNSRDFKTFPKELYPFLNQLRKLNVSLFLICQKPDQLDAMVRRVVNQIYDYRKGLFIIRLKDVYDSYDEQCNILDPVSTKFNHTIPLLGPLLFNLYDRVVSLIGLDKYKGSIKYDTHELILPILNMIVGDINKILPINPVIDEMDFREYYDSKREKLKLRKY